MEFKVFMKKMYKALSNGQGRGEFTKDILEAILTEEGVNSLDYTVGTYKSYFYGYTGLSGYATKVNGALEVENFDMFLNKYEDGAIQNLCDIFKDDIPGLTPHNASEVLGNTLQQIILNAAGEERKSTHKGAKNNDIGGFSDVAPELTAENADSVFFIDSSFIKNVLDEDDGEDPFLKYLERAKDYYSTKKTLLYAEKPHPFYELYVCNDIKYRKFRATGFRDPKPEKVINDATVALLEEESNYIIIQGTGGIGKSMMMTHLFLDAVSNRDETEKTPFFLSLKDYNDATCGFVDFIWKSVLEYDANVSQRDMIELLQRKKCILLLDGLDEIQTSIKEDFDRDLEAFTKSYPGNTIIITSRPVNQFIAYSKFALFDILPLSKKQAINLVEKLEFWDESGKTNFLKALETNLFSSHYEFASNPLLLTIMLMTYSTFGEVPAKIHVFYTKAYETMARLHDASKGSFKRPLYTGLTPEEFSKYFAQFCARTYKDEMLEFDIRLFSHYMQKVIDSLEFERKGLNPRDFLLDLTDNLCIMYKEGDQYYFIHRSFQEYFAALHFSTEYDSKLTRIGNFFEHMKHRSYSDKTFDMLYDMIPEKIERFVFLPFLDELFSECGSELDKKAYWNFLENKYPILYREEGEVGEMYINESDSFLYRSIVKFKKLFTRPDIESYEWPDEVTELPTRDWAEVYDKFTEGTAFHNYPDPDCIPEEALEATCIWYIDDLPYDYSNYFGEPEACGRTTEIEIYELRNNLYKYKEVRQCMEEDDFPLMKEYKNVRDYHKKLKLFVEAQEQSDDLFDD